MGTSKRERQKQGRQARIAQAQAAAARRKRMRSAVLLGILVVALVGVTLAVGGVGDDDEAVDALAGSTTTTLADGSTSSTGEPPVTVAITIPPAGATIEGETPCPPADGTAARTTQFASPPPNCIDAAKTYTAEVTTSQGAFTLELDDEVAPAAVNNFVVLSRYHYYDGVGFHRIIPGFMIQGGDAVGPSPGQGGPGYAISDELPTGENAYPPGTLAMANSGPNTSGSQFFVMATGSTGLPNDYTVFGRVAAGQEVVDAINQLGDGASNGTPTAEVVIQSIAIVES